MCDILVLSTQVPEWTARHLQVCLYSNNQKPDTHVESIVVYHHLPDGLQGLHHGLHEHALSQICCLVEPRRLAGQPTIIHE